MTRPAVFSRAEANGDEFVRVGRVLEWRYAHRRHLSAPIGSAWFGASPR
jgi:hypothetical protein